MAFESVVPAALIALFSSVIELWIKWDDASTLSVMQFIFDESF